MEWEIQGRYGTQYGWECVTTEDSLDNAREQLDCYNANEPQFPHRIVRIDEDGAKEVVV